jgi:hypothetical protein
VQHVCSGHQRCPEPSCNFLIFMGTTDALKRTRAEPDKDEKEKKEKRPVSLASIGQKVRSVVSVVSMKGK